MRRSGDVSGSCWERTSTEIITIEYTTDDGPRGEARIKRMQRRGAENRLAALWLEPIGRNRDFAIVRCAGPRCRNRRKPRPLVARNDRAERERPAALSHGRLHHRERAVRVTRALR